MNPGAAFGGPMGAQRGPKGPDPIFRAECAEPVVSLNTENSNNCRNEVHTRGLPFGWRRIQSLRAFRRAVLFRLFAWWLVGLSSLRLSVCSFDRGIFLRSVRELVLGASWASFWELGGSPGHHFGFWGLLLGSILGVWGCLGLHFWSSGTPLVPLGLLGGPPWPPKVPKAKFSHFFPSHFGLILASFWR